jgi:hypothetical protein
MAFAVGPAGTALELDDVVVVNVVAVDVVVVDVVVAA